MSNVIVKENETLDSALRRFKTDDKKSLAVSVRPLPDQSPPDILYTGAAEPLSAVLHPSYSAEHYEKPSVRRKKKSEAARKRKYN